MSAKYVPVQWTRHKKVYDAVLVTSVIAYLALFVGLGKFLFRGDESVSDPILILRALGSCAFLMLNVVLCIGPLARLDARFLTLLYNRRHLGVATYCVALLHGFVAVGFYHGFGIWNPLYSLLISNTNYGSLIAFPYQTLGLLALIILSGLAFTSHDFWNRNLGQRVWKALHMFAYAAYGFVVVHIALGAMQAPRGTAIQIMLVLLIGTVTVLHLVAGVRERRRDRTTAEPGRGSDFIRQSQGNQPECQSSTLPLNGVRSTSSDVIPEANWIMACRVEDIPPDRARIIRPAGGERIAVFRHGNRISAVTNVCAHQGGPLGEGKIINGCITCPWHGWTYQPHDGCAPPPFDEKIATYGVKIVDNIVYVDSIPLSPGTDTSPACFGDEKNVQSTAG